MIFLNDIIQRSIIRFRNYELFILKYFSYHFIQLSNQNDNMDIKYYIRGIFDQIYSYICLRFLNVIFCIIRASHTFLMNNFIVITFYNKYKIKLKIINLYYIIQTVQMYSIEN